MSNEAKKQAVLRDYLSALEDLTFNSKHCINMLTKLAEKNQRFVKDIVAIVEAQIVKAPLAEKLPVLYLVDSIMKNLEGEYLVEFSKNIITSFISVFEKVEMDTRRRLRRLRDSWNIVFPLETLYALDIRVNSIDPSWPIKRPSSHANSSFAMNPKGQQLADSQLASTEVRTRDPRLQNHLHDKAPVRKEEETQLRMKIRCADDEDGEAVNASESRSPGRTGGPASASAVSEREREEGGFERGPVNKKKRPCSRSSKPLLLPSNKNKSRSLILSSPAKIGNRNRAVATYSLSEDFPQSSNVEDGRAVPTSDTLCVARSLPLESVEVKLLKQPEEDLLLVVSDPKCMTRFVSEPSPVNKKKRTFSGSPTPLLPISKIKHIHLPERSLTFVLSSPAKSGKKMQSKDKHFSQLARTRNIITAPPWNTSDTQRAKSKEDETRERASKKYSSGCEEFKHGSDRIIFPPAFIGQSLRQSEETLCRTTAFARLTQSDRPLSQLCPPGFPCPPNLQSSLGQVPPMFSAPRTQHHFAHLHSHGLPYPGRPSLRLCTPADMSRGAPHPFQMHHGMPQRAGFGGLPVAGASTIYKPHLTPVTPSPSFGYMSAFVQAGSAFQGPGFGFQPAIAFGQAFIPPSPNPVPFNQPGIFSRCCDRAENVNMYVSSALHFAPPASHLNVNSLVTRLISAGLIKPTQTAPTQPSKAQPAAKRQEKEDLQKFPDLTGFVREDMKKRYDSVVTELYTGQQCSSCGLRFSPAQTDKYKDHLDWHYRQNRSMKDAGKKDVHRGWYGSAQDWIEHDKLADLKERAKDSGFFEQPHEEATQRTQEQGLQSVTAAVDVFDESCGMCGEQFDMDWDDEREQWRLKNAIRADGKTYHPPCYEDQQKHVINSNPSPSEVQVENAASNT